MGRFWNQRKKRAPQFFNSNSQIKDQIVFSGGSIDNEESQVGSAAAAQGARVTNTKMFSQVVRLIMMNHRLALQLQPKVLGSQIPKARLDSKRHLEMMSLFLLWKAAGFGIRVDKGLYKDSRIKIVVLEDNLYQDLICHSSLLPHLMEVFFLVCQGLVKMMR